MVSVGKPTCPDFELPPGTSAMAATSPGPVLSRTQGVWAAPWPLPLFPVPSHLPHFCFLSSLQHLQHLLAFLLSLFPWVLFWLSSPDSERYRSFPTPPHDPLPSWEPLAIPEAYTHTAMSHMRALGVGKWEADWELEGLTSVFSGPPGQVWHDSTVKCGEFSAINAPTPTSPESLQSSSVSAEERWPAKRCFPWEWATPISTDLGVFHVVTQSILYSIPGPLEGLGFAKQISQWCWFTSIQKSKNLKIKLGRWTPHVKLAVRWVHLALNWILNRMAHLFNYCSHYGLLRHQKSVFYSQQLDSEIINKHTLF